MSMSAPYSQQTAYPRKLTPPVQAAHAPVSAFVWAVSCPVCEAVYAPAQSHQHLLHSPAIALESAFMSMCRFCFRCRRPSCPSCWDTVNGLCGACVQELVLPFRQELKPFAGALPLPQLTSRQTSKIPSLQPTILAEAPLRCVYTGRFQQLSDALIPGTLIADALVATDPLPVAQGVKQSATGTLTTRPSMPDDIEAQPTQPPTSTSQGPSTSRVAYIAERVFTSLFLTLLSLAILFIVGASLSTQMNSGLVHVLHIDIHGIELTLWSAIHQLFGK